MSPTDEPRSRFGPTIRRYCLPVIYYLWEFGIPEATRTRRLNVTTDASRKDLLGSVKPFIGEISTALDDPDCADLERELLADFAATYEAIIDMLRVPFDRISPAWNQYQLPADPRVNRALFDVFRGLDLYDRGQVMAAAEHMRPGWKRLFEIEKRRALPEPLRRLVRDSKPVLTKFQADFLRLRDGVEAEHRDLSGLPSVGHLLGEREQGRMQGMRDLHDRDPVTKKNRKPAAEIRSKGLVFDLAGQDSVEDLTGTEASPRPGAPAAPGPAGGAPPETGDFIPPSYEDLTDLAPPASPGPASGAGPGAAGLDSEPPRGVPSLPSSAFEDLDEVPLDSVPAPFADPEGVDLTTREQATAHAELAELFED